MVPRADEYYFTENKRQTVRLLTTTVDDLQRDDICKAVCSRSALPDTIGVISKEADNGNTLELVKPSFHANQMRLVFTSLNVWHTTQAGHQGEEYKI